MGMENGKSGVMVTKSGYCEGGRFDNILDGSKANAITSENTINTDRANENLTDGLNIQNHNLPDGSEIVINMLGNSENTIINSNLGVGGQTLIPENYKNNNKNVIELLLTKEFQNVPLNQDNRNNSLKPLVTLRPMDDLSKNSQLTQVINKFAESSNKVLEKLLFNTRICDSQELNKDNIVNGTILFEDERNLLNLKANDNGWQALHKKIFTDHQINHLSEYLNVKNVRISSETVKADNNIFGTIAANNDIAKTGSVRVSDISGLNKMPVNNDVISGQMNNTQASDNLLDEQIFSNNEKNAGGKPFIKSNFATDNRLFDELMDSNTGKSSNIKIGSISGAKFPSNISAVKNNEVTPVRFIIPDYLKPATMKEKQTISIKMIPEHLGTVRLTLSSYQSALTGRIIVDNSAALATVESNLNSLIDDLAERGIKIDAFEVSMAGDQYGRHSSQSQSSAAPKNKSGFSDNNELIANEDVSDSPRQTNQFYANATGVNLLV
jgi:hypothetical protein